MTEEERFNNKIQIIDMGYTTPCHIWIAATDKDGYGQFRYNNKAGKAHRFAYERFKDKIPDGLQIDHKCRIRNCVNPEHLEPVTNKQNGERSIYAMQTHCIHGHEYNKQNTEQTKNNGRRCIICRNQRSKERNRRIKRT